MKEGDKVSWNHAYKNREVVELKKRATGVIIGINKYNNVAVKRDGNFHRAIVPLKHLSPPTYHAI